MKTQQPLIWIITNGRRGDIVQCRAVAEGLSNTIVEKVAAPCPPFSWLAPYGPISPFDKALIAPPYPDVIIAAGRQAAPYVKAIQKAAHNKVRVVFMKYPGRTLPSNTLYWIPEHDSHDGPNIIKSLTSPHLVTKKVLANHKKKPDPRLKEFSHPRLGILLGGSSKHLRFNDAAIAEFCKPLLGDMPFAAYFVTGSRRTPPALLKAVEKALSPRPTFIWDGTGDNPYFSILANSDALLVTGDSHNMVSEALAAGRQVYVYNPPGNSEKFQWTLNKLEEKGLIKPYGAQMTGGKAKAFDATPSIVAQIQGYFDL